MDRLCVFVDEYGDPHLDVDKKGVSLTYIVAAFCVRKRDVDEALANAELVRKKYFQSGEMKSSSIGSNGVRRQQVLRDLFKVSGFVIAFCAQKNRVNKSSGLAFKKTFIKYFANELCKRVYRCADEVEFCFDQHGTHAFSEEVQKYLKSKYMEDGFIINDLFMSPPTFTYEDSKGNVLLQVADIFAGSLARVYDEKKASDCDGVLKNVLKERVSLTLWPSGRELGAVPESEHLSENDERVRRYCLRRAEEYLSKLENSYADKDDAARGIFLDALIAHHMFGGSDEYLSTKSLQREISSQLGDPISDHRFRSTVVAKLRDADVVISSCSRGYRLPTCVADLVEFASFANSQILPMVGRVIRARKGVREATLGSVDMLAGAGLDQLRLIAGAIEP